MKVPRQEQLDDEEIEALFQKMTAKQKPKVSKIGLLFWLFPAACVVMLIVVWWRLWA